MAGVLVIGSSNTDLVCRSTRIPAPGETITGRSFATFAGGKGANQAVAAARARADVIFVGARGDDDFGIAREADLVAEGINVDRLRVVPGVSSGIASIVVDDRGENQIVYVPGANSCISVDDAASALRDVEHRVLSLTFEVPIETVVFAVQHKRDDALVVLNAAPYDERLVDLLDHLDVLICNEAEASALLGQPVSSETAMDAATAILERGPRSVVLTLGASGAFAADASGAWHSRVPPVEPVDTTGAGDAFCGVLCAWLAGGKPLREAVRAGVVAGSLAVTREGAQPALPTRDAIVAAIDMMDGG
ncbi:MAG: ribokinase [Chloroflexota bacterium]|nr:ribokinase [Chloroflexota bacterium]